MQRKIRNLVILSLLSLIIIGVQTYDTNAYIEEVTTETIIVYEEWTLWLSVRYYKLDITTTVRFNNYGEATIYKQRLKLYTTTSGWLPPGTVELMVEYNGDGDYWKGYSPDVYHDGGLVVAPLHKTDYDTFYVSRDNVILRYYCWYSYIDGHTGWYHIIGVGHGTYEFHT
ncbi:MAG: hypothetical protein GF308_03045 [Candidatus Heimdallarchaeota archaeon]|nr:hypothetical protein [Candidatus Heimdallarchaeota archaeon]